MNTVLCFEDEVRYAIQVALWSLLTLALDLHRVLD
jgi:hypothetical protein